MRRPSLCLCLVLAALAASACRRHHPPAQAVDAGGVAMEVMWTARSSSGKEVVEQRGNGTQCVLTATGTKEWTRESCIATADQLVFVSEDGTHLLVIDPQPAVKDDQWHQAKVIWVYEWNSLQLLPIKLGEM